MAADPYPNLVHRAEEDECVETDSYSPSFVWVFFPLFSLSRQTWNCPSHRQHWITENVSSDRSQATDLGEHQLNQSFKYKSHYKSFHWLEPECYQTCLFQVFQAWLVSVSLLSGNIWKCPFGQFLCVCCCLRRGNCPCPLALAEVTGLVDPSYSDISANKRNLHTQCTCMVWDRGHLWELQAWCRVFPACLCGCTPQSLVWLLWHTEEPSCTAKLGLCPGAGTSTHRSHHSAKEQAGVWTYIK